jgi:uncharacterized protein YggE
MPTTYRCILLGALGLLLAPACAVAQFGNAPGSISASGTVVVKELPVVVRMNVQLSGKAKTLKEALAKLKDRREAAVLQVEALNAAKDSIKVSGPSYSDGKTDQQRQMERMVLRQRAQTGRRAKGLELPKSVTVTSVLSAEWPLEAKTQEERLLFAKVLEEKVAAADLAGLKEPKQLTPEEEELAEELAEAGSQYGFGGEQAATPGEPQFSYVGKISSKKRDEALASAFQQAKTQAEQLAKAAGANLGSLSSLSGNVSQSGDDGYGYQMQMMMRQQGLLGEGAASDESLSSKPEAVSFQVVVQVAFRIE